MARTPQERPVASAAEALATFLTLAEDLLPLADEDGQHTLGSAAHSQPPWNSAVADAIMTPHAGIRALERQVRMETAGTTGEARGDSHANTLKALEILPSLAAGLDKDLEREVAHKLSKWTDLSLRLPAIDQLLRWQPVRAQEGCLPPLCPYCKSYSLRVAPERGLVACWKPACLDGDKRRPFGRLDYSKITGDPIIAWHDGLVQGPG